MTFTFDLLCLCVVCDYIMFEVQIYSSAHLRKLPAISREEWRKEQILQSLLSFTSPFPERPSRHLTLNHGAADKPRRWTHVAALRLCSSVVPSFNPTSRLGLVCVCSLFSSVTCQLAPEIKGHVTDLRCVSSGATSSSSLSSCKSSDTLSAHHAL